MKKKNVLLNSFYINVIFCFSVIQTILGNKVNIFIDNMGTIYKQNFEDMNNNNNNNSVNKIELKIPDKNNNWIGNVNILSLKDSSIGLEKEKYDQGNEIVCECKIVVSK